MLQRMRKNNYLSNIFIEYKCWINMSLGELQQDVVLYICSHEQLYKTIVVWDSVQCPVKIICLSVKAAFKLNWKDKH